MTLNPWALLFWFAAALIVYTYAGYPVIAMLAARWRTRPVASDENHRPTVSLIIAACNEEKTIREKLENTLRLTYPRAFLEVIVVADGSSDGTAAIVSEYSGRGVRLLHQPERQGKTAALNRAVAASTGEILLFSDANTDYGPDTIERIVCNFADGDVGGVSGRKIVLEDTTRDATDGEAAYWTYESWLKVCESRAGSIVTADGEIFAMRRCLFAPMPRTIVHDDMYLTLSIVDFGSRVIYEPRATSGECASRTLYDEFHLKVRYASAGYQIVSSFRRMLLPPRSWFAVQFLSHKVLRWLAPFWLIAVFAASGMAALDGGIVYRVAFLSQVLFYAAALVGWPLHRTARFAAVYFPFYFSVMNYAAFYGAARYIARGQTTLWRKAAR